MSAFAPRMQIPDASELRRTAFSDGLPAVLSSEAFAEGETPKSRRVAVALLRPLPEREPLAGATKGILRSGWHAIRSSEIPAVRLR